MSIEIATVEIKEQLAEAAQRWLEAVERRRGSTRSKTEYEKTFKTFLVTSQYYG